MVPNKTGMLYNQQDGVKSSLQAFSDDHLLEIWSSNYLRCYFCACCKFNPRPAGQWQEPIKPVRKSFRLTPRSEVAITQKHCPPHRIFLYLWIRATVFFRGAQYNDVFRPFFHNCRLLSGFEVPLWHGRPISGRVPPHRRKRPWGHQ